MRYMSYQKLYQLLFFLNRINKFLWKIIIFLSKFIKVDDINHLNDKPTDTIANKLVRFMQK